jgi:SAM-dependent methyltransferase
MIGEPSAPFDDLSEDALSTQVKVWASKSEAPACRFEDIDEYFNLIRPKSVFLKALRSGASVLDLGGRDESLAIYKTWPKPKREELTLYAASSEVGGQYDKYAAYEIGDIEIAPPFKGRQFDAIVCAHFIERIKSPELVVNFINEHLPAGGRLYLEWPHLISKKMPSHRQILVPVQPYTMRYTDDAAHVRQLWNLEEMKDGLLRAGLKIEVVGRQHFPWVAEQLRNHAHITKDRVTLTHAIWTYVGWAQYIVAFKPEEQL